MKTVIQVSRLEALALEPAAALQYAHDIVASCADEDIEPIERAVEALMQYGDLYPAGFWVQVVREVERLSPPWRY